MASPYTPTFTDYILNNYGVSIPFFNGTFDEAKREAQQSAKYLVVYLHCPTHENTHAFLTSVLGDDEVIAHFSENTVLFGASVMDRPGYRLSLDLHATTYPFVGVLFKRAVIMRLQGPYLKQEFLQQWKVCTDAWDGAVAEEVSFRFEREARERARLVEENAMSEMERADMERLAQFEAEEKAQRELQEKAQREAETKRKAEEEEAAARAKEEARKQAEQAERERVKATAQQAAAVRLPPEPPADANAQEVVLISVKSLSGKQHQRRFWRTDLVEHLMDFAVSLDEYDGSEVSLVTGFPPAVLQWEAGRTRFGDVRSLCPRAVVLMRRVS